MKAPNPNTAFPLKNYDRLCFLKNVVKNSKITIGDYTYYDDFETVENFEKNVKYLFDFIDDELIIGKFCMIASDVKFIMNGANHLSNAISAYPFAVFGKAWSHAMEGKSYPNKGKTIVGNDVWIGYNATIMSGVTIGDGVIIAANTTVVKNVEPYTIVGGNPAKEIRKRFSKPDIEKLLELKWWNWPIEKITTHVQNLTSNQIESLNI